MCEFAHQAVSEPELLASALLRDGVYDLLVRMFLASFPVTTPLPLVPARLASAPTAAIHHMNTHAKDFLSVADVAAIARLSMRAVQAGVRRHTGQTVMQYLRDRRLDGVRQKLLTSARAAKTVTSVATAWGFVHLGRFANDYRERFGDLPRDTIRG